MKMYLILKILLALHITGIVIMAGTTVIDYLTSRTFWKLVESGDAKYRGLVPLMAQYGSMIRLGAILIFVTGITMLTLENNVWTNQLWFKVKMVLVFLIIIHGLFVGNVQGTRLREAVANNKVNFLPETVKIRASLNRFYPLQLTLFFLVVLLSTTRIDKLKF